MIWQMIAGLDMYSLYADPAPHIVTAGTGSTAVVDVNDLDRDLSEV